MIRQMRGNDWLLLILLVTLCAFLRLDNIDANSITQDESTMVLFAQGVLEAGYPFMYQGDDKFIISTYELVPYPIALSFLFFGQDLLGLRMPAVLFSCLTCSLLWLWSQKLYGRRVALVSTLIYSLLPWTIYWGSNGFYPAQVQFFALLTMIQVHRILTDAQVPPTFFYGTAFTFMLTYLTWEGSGFILPAIFILALALRWGRWYWLFNWHAWLAAFLMLLGVVSQLTYRTLLRQPYLGIGSSRSDVSFASLAFLEPQYDPFFYLRSLVSESHLVIIALLLLGLFWTRRDLTLRFLYLFPAICMLFLTSALGYYALRYFYFLAPYLILAAGVTAVYLADASRSLAGLIRGQQTLLRHGFLGTLGLLLLLTIPSGLLLPIQGLRSLEEERPFELRPSLRGFGFREMNRALLARLKPGDIVIAEAPFPLKAATGIKGDYLIQAIPATPVYFVKASFPYYADKWVSSPVLRNLEELQDVLQRHHRVWFVLAPEGAVRGMIGDELFRYILQNAEVVRELADGKLLLWRNPAPVQEG